MNYAETVLAAVFPADKKRFLYCSERLNADHLSDHKAAQALFQIADRFFSHFSELPSAAVVKDVLTKNFEPGMATMIWQVFANACATGVGDSEFYHCVDQILSEVAENATGEAIAVSYQALTQGIDLDGEHLEGHEAARRYLLGRLAAIEQHGLSKAAPEGDVATEAADILQAYLKQKNSPEAVGVQTGFKSLDESSGGLQPGDLMLIAAWTSHGKSMMSVNMAWKAAVKQGKNVYYATSETSRSSIIHRMLALHSRLPQFECPEGLDHTKIRRGSLNGSEEKVLAKVLEDLHYNPAYGKFHVAQVETDATLNSFGVRMLHKHQDWGVDLAVMDYLNLLRPDTKRSTQREEASDILKAAKVLATSFSGGDGVPLVSPWQIGRAAYEQAASGSQRYTLAALSDTSEAEKSSDVIVALWYDHVVNRKKASLQPLKVRNGAVPSPISLDVDYRCAYLSQSGSAGSTTVSSTVASSTYGSMSALMGSALPS